VNTHAGCTPNILKSIELVSYHKQSTWRPQRQHNFSNKQTLLISTTSGEAHSWQHHIVEKWHNRAPASGEYTITPEDGRVRPKHVLIEFKK
jgi:hypothetical protein